MSAVTATERMVSRAGGLTRVREMPTDRAEPRYATQRGRSEQLRKGIVNYCA